MNTTITNATNGSIVHVTRFPGTPVHPSTTNHSLLIVLGVIAVLLIFFGLYLLFRKEKRAAKHQGQAEIPGRTGRKDKNNKI